MEETRISLEAVHKVQLLHLWLWWRWISRRWRKWKRKSFVTVGKIWLVLEFPNDSWMTISLLPSGPALPRFFHWHERYPESCNPKNRSTVGYECFPVGGSSFIMMEEASLVTAYEWVSGRPKYYERLLRYEDHPRFIHGWLAQRCLNGEVRRPVMRLKPFWIIR